MPPAGLEPATRLASCAAPANAQRRHLVGVLRRARPERAKTIRAVSIDMSWSRRGSAAMGHPPQSLYETLGLGGAGRGGASVVAMLGATRAPAGGTRGPPRSRRHPAISARCAASSATRALPRPGGRRARPWRRCADAPRTPARYRRVGRELRRRRAGASRRRPRGARGRRNRAAHPELLRRAEARRLQHRP